MTDRFNVSSICLNCFVCFLKPKVEFFAQLLFSLGNSKVIFEFLFATEYSVSDFIPKCLEASNKFTSRSRRREVVLSSSGHLMALKWNSVRSSHVSKFLSFLDQNVLGLIMPIRLSVP